MSGLTSENASGDRCRVVTGTHAGKSGKVEDRNISKTGQVTITVRLADGTRFKTFARNVVAEPR
jgi:ribosomal protein S4E